MLPEDFKRLVAEVPVSPSTSMVENDCIQIYQLTGLIGSLGLQEMATLTFCNNKSLEWLFSLGLEYADVCMPFFHRPTILISSLPTLLVLAICCLGSFLFDDPESLELGALLHKHIWRSVFLVSSYAGRMPALLSNYKVHHRKH